MKGSTAYHFALRGVGGAAFAIGMRGIVEDVALGDADFPPPHPLPSSGRASREAGRVESYWPR